MYWLIYHYTFYLYVKKNANHILLLVHCCKLLNGQTITKCEYRFIRYHGSGCNIWEYQYHILFISMHIPIEIQKFAVYCCIDIFSPFMKLFTKFLSQYGRSKYCSKFENIIAFLVHIIYCLTLFVFYYNNLDLYMISPLTPYISESQPT